MPASHVVVDGSNIATEGRSMPSLTQLDEAVQAFLAERPHDACTVVVDATFEHRIDPAERKIYDEALAANEMLTPPAGTIGRGDKFILQIADRVDATVFSNDSFQEFHGEYEWLFHDGRLVGGKPVPGVGWIFAERTPVRGPKSRQATSAVTRKRTKAASGSVAKKAASSRATASKATGPGRSGGRASKAASEPMPKPKAPPPGARRSRSSGSGTHPVNEPLPFIEFIAENQLGSEVEGQVVEFSSHGAYVEVGPVRCYLGLKYMGDPAPRAAREVLERDETRTFVVQAIDAPRRGIDLALPGFADSVPEAPSSTRKRATPRRRATAGTKEAAETRTSVDATSDQAPAAAGAELPESEAILATKATKKKAPAKKKTAAKKTTAAKRSTAKKTTAKRSTAKKSTTKKKAPARKAPAKKKTAARKAPAKKKTAARKAPAKKKATAKKSTAKRTAKR